MSWTEEGHNFSWHMKLREKGSTAKFFVTDPVRRTTREVQLRKYLAGHQADKMAARPDMILQFSHHLAETMRRQGHEKVEVRAKVMASLNGRKQQLLIDPEVDLAAQARSLKPKPWIMPLLEPLLVQTSRTTE